MSSPTGPAQAPAPSLHTRMLRHAMLPLSLTWLIGTVVTLGVASHFTERAFDRALLDDAYSIASQVETQPSGAVGLLLTPKELRAALFDQVEAVHFAVLRPDGTLLAGANLPHIRPPLLSQAFRYGNMLHEGQVVRAVVLRHEVQSQRYHVVIAHTTRVRNELVQQMLLYGALPLLLLLGLFGFALRRSIQRDLAPLGQLQSALAHRDAQDLTPVVMSPSTQEIE